MNEIQLIRQDFRMDGIFGILQNSQNELLAYTLEHSYLGAPKLPIGEYVCQRGLHRLKNSMVPFLTYEVLHVPNHSGILFHMGNTNTDSDGCILLGSGIIKPNSVSFALSDSKIAFNKFMLSMGAYDHFQLKVSQG